MSDATIEGLIESYLARRIEGSAEGVEEFVAAHPEHAAVLRRRLLQLDGLDELAPRGNRAKFDVPARFDGFELVRELGRGGMGVVYEARQTALGRRVAIKVIAAGGALSSRLRERFEREITTLARISHPNIVKVFGSGVVAGAPYVAMELVDGEPLTLRLPREDERVSRERVDELVRIGERAARALDHVHELGVVHRDVKPGNVLIDARGEPVLLDFGLARGDERDSITATGEFVGTLAYTAPEQARGERVDRRADVYGLGATLYHLVAGAPPYRARSLSELVRLIDAGPPSSACRLNPSLPRDLATVLEHATHPDPTQRYASCADLADELGRVRDGVPVQARVPSTWTVLTRLAQRHKAFVIGAVSVMVALAVGLAAALKQAQLKQREAARLLLQREWSDRMFERAVGLADPAKRGALILEEERIARSSFAGDPELLANALDMLARLASADGRSDLPLTLAREALALRSELGTSAEDTIESKFTAASVHQIDDDLELAIALYRDIENYYESAGQSNDERALTAKHNRAKCLLDQDRTEEALQLLYGTQQAVVATLGPTHPLALTIDNTLALWLIHHGDREEGWSKLEHIVDVRRCTLGSADSDTVAWVDNLANARFERREWEPGVALFREVVNVRTAQLPLDHPDRLLAVFNLGTALALYGKFGEAEDVLTELRSMRERREGCYTRESLECLLVLVGNHARRAHNAAKPDVREQQLGEAEDLMDELRERMRAVSWPADDELSGSVLRDFAQLLQIRGRWDESELPLLEAWRVFDRREPVCRDQLEKLAAHWDAVDRWDDAARLRELIGD